MDLRFGRKFQDDASKIDKEIDFEVENYLQYKGKKFSESFDANSYIIMTKAMDGYDAAGKKDSLDEALKEKAGEDKKPEVNEPKAPTKAPAKK